jgi:hypothetical protein
MDILKNNWDSPLEYVVSLFNNFSNTNITKKRKKIVFNIYNFFFENNTNILINEILFNLFISISLTKVLRNPKI